MKPILILFVFFCLICSVESAAQNSAPYALAPKSCQTLPGQTACLNIKTADDDLGDTVRISWSTAVQMATFTHNSGAVQHAEGQICWTPTNSDPRPEPYLFFITMDDGHVQVVDTFFFYVGGFPERDSFSFQEGACGELLVWSDFNDWVDSVRFHFYRYGFVSFTFSWPPMRSDLNLSDLRSGTYVLETYIWNNLPLSKKYIDTIVLVGGHELITKKTLLGEPNQYYIEIKNFSPNPEVKYSWAVVNRLGLTILPDTLSELIIQVWEYTLLRAVVSSDKPCNDTLWFELKADPSSLREAEDMATIFPNPCINELNVESHKPIMSLTLFDIQGKQVLQQEEDKTLTTHLEVTGLPKGTYLLAIRYIDGSTGHHSVVVR